MKKIITAAAALLMAATAHAASEAPEAKPTYLYRGSRWSAYSITATDGNPMCGMMTNSGNVNIQVKYNGTTVFLHFLKDSWSIPDGTRIPGWLRLDEAARVEINGSGHINRFGKSYVEFKLDAATSSRFAEQFKSATRMTIGFNYGTQSPISASMIGSREAGEAWTRCATKIVNSDPFAIRPPGLEQPFDKLPTSPAPKKYLAPFVPKTGEGMI